jgi:16S rRNA (cytosine1402-N4)-methyltransferase
MQIDDPSRGFSTKQEGPLDMRMNPARGQSAVTFLRGINPAKLARLLEENSDEPHSERLAAALAGKSFPTTLSLGSAIRAELSRFSEEAVELTVRRVFQALRIEVNDEFCALDSLLRQLPSCLNPGGRIAILTFHSGEDRRVKKSLASGRDASLYSQISEDVIRPTAAERNANSRSSSAKLRWARRSGP